MSLRNKITILSITLMSLMTIPTLAENDTAPVNSRIEDPQFDVQIKTPEGWSETKSFNHTVPDQLEINGMLFKGITFKNGTELHGCAVFFGVDTDDEDIKISDKIDLEKTYAEVQEKAFPDAQMPIYTLEKLNASGAFEIDVSKQVAKFNVNGAFEGNALYSGVSKKISLTGNLTGDTTVSTLAIGSGKLTAGDELCMYGSIGVLMDDDYQVIVVAWGSDEATLRNDVHNFMKATAVTKKTPVAEIVAEPLAVQATSVVNVEAPAVVEVAKIELTIIVETPAPAVVEAAKAEPVIAVEAPAVVEAPVASSEEVKPVVAEVASTSEVTKPTEEAVKAEPEAVLTSSEAVSPATEVSATTETPA